ncbi:MAG: glycosyltransferase family 39 protein [Planctomycetota bacterium]
MSDSPHLSSAARPLDGPPAALPAAAVSPRVWLGVALLTLLAAGLRLLRLDHGGLWYDELIMARITAGGWDKVWEELLLTRPPVYPLLGYAWSSVFGGSDAAIRLLPALLGVATVPVMFLVGRRLFGVAAGLLTAGLLAVAPYQVYYSQEHRYYALVMLLTVASIALLLRGLRVGEPAGGDGGRARWGSWAGHGVASVLMLLTHPLSALILGPVGLAVLALAGLGRLRWRRVGVFVGVQVGVMVAFVPWVLWKLGLMSSRVESGTMDADGFVPWITSPPWWAPVRTAGNFMFLGARYLRADLTLLGGLVLLAGVAVAWWRCGGMSGGLAAARRYGARLGASLRGRSSAWGFAAVWAAGPVLLLAAVSWAAKPLYVDRYIIAASGGLYLLVAAALVAGARVLPAWSVAGAIALGMAGSLTTYYQAPGKGAWPEAAAWLDGAWLPGEAVAFSSERGNVRETEHVRRNWFWYAEAGRDAPQTDVDVRAAPAVVAERLREAASGPRHAVWLVLWRDTAAPVGLDTAFAEPVAGVRLDRVERFFDLTLMRFVCDDAAEAGVELAESQDPGRPAGVGASVGLETPGVASGIGPEDASPVVER